MTPYVYKVLRRSEWHELLETGTFAGSPDDLRDGFVHLSTLEQLPGTLKRHFAGRSDLVLLEISTAVLGDSLRWEPSRSGALFPHLHGVLRKSDVRLHSNERP
jgi:uncharacterized protein (DUF952 family)